MHQILAVTVVSVAIFPFCLALQQLLTSVFCYIQPSIFQYVCKLFLLFESDNFYHSSQNFDILHGVDLDTVKSSLFELRNWSGIYCAEAKQNENFASKRRQANHENLSMSNGLHDAKVTKRGIYNVSIFLVQFLPSIPLEHPKAFIKEFSCPLVI